MNMPPDTLLYVSATGVLQPLGYSQVVRVLKALSRKGWRYSLISLERSADMGRPGALDAMHAELADAGIAWTPRPYRDAARNVATLSLETARLARSCALVHARSYQPALAAYFALRLHNTPYLFDKRGYWIDEKRDEGRWFAHPLAYSAGKSLERTLFESCAGVVSLSRHGVDDVRGGVFGAWPHLRPVVNIPTVVDYDSFTIEPDTQSLPADLLARLEGKLVVGYIGSLNASYKVDAMCDLFARTHSLNPNAHLLGLTGQPEALAERLGRAGAPTDSFTLTRSPHELMPSWLSMVDWGLMLLNSTYAKRASMPTKLAEFFAAGVRPVQLGCNADVGEWVARAGSGISLEDTSDAELDRAAERIAASERRAAQGAALRARLEHAREVTRPHFSLDSGVDAYDRLLDSLVRSSHRGAS
jgi:glycosyltransferase involved in cell wall biosynthesis